LDLSSLVVSCIENRQKAKHLSRLAMTDYLTGLPNRAHFERALNSELAHSRRTGELFSVLFMDLDGFKEINDTHGHAAGDKVLSEVALRLSAQVRQEDMVARFGGDEFAVFIRQRAQDTTELLTQRIEQSVAEPILLSSHLQVSVGISIGRATYNDTTNTVSSLIARADQSLYQLKKARKIPTGDTNPALLSI
jgi:diguanylate cyclase (GGDEF)-like protein